MYSSNTLVFVLQEFRLLHFAGDVTYNVKGFLDKNNDLLFRDLKEVGHTDVYLSECNGLCMV